MVTPFSTRRRILWLGAAVVLAVAGAVAGLAVQRAKTRHTPVAAYIIPISENCRIKPFGWPSVRLDAPRTLRSGQSFKVPAGSTVRVVHAVSGESTLAVGPTHLSMQQKLPSETAALVSPLADVIALARAIASQPHDSFFVSSPVGKTRYLNPLITWAARDGVLYDVAVVDPGDPLLPPRVARGVRPPLALADLQTPLRRQLSIDRIYEVAIREAGADAISGVARFLTTTDAQVENQIPATSADLMVEATSAMAQAPTRAGDAWLALTRLPPSWAQSELGLRLRLHVSSTLGLADELARAEKEARKLNAW